MNLSDFFKKIVETIKGLFSGKPEVVVIPEPVKEEPAEPEMPEAPPEVPFEEPVKEKETAPEPVPEAPKATATAVLPKVHIAIPLKKGSRGEDVLEVQQFFKILNLYKGNLDSIFGPQLEAAVRSYQTSKGLVADGIIGRVTLTAMGGTQQIEDGPHHLPVEPDRPDASDEVMLWYPDRIATNITQPTSGSYPKGYPEGLVVHWVWAPQKPTALQWLQYGKDQGYAFFTLGSDGAVAQGSPLNRWGSHAGTSYWPNLGSSVSKRLAGIEVVCEGKVTKYADGTYGNGPNRKVPASQIRHVPAKNANQAPGYYQKYTEAQEKALTKLILWLKWNNPTVFNLDYVLGHDEVAGPSGLGLVNAAYKNSWRKVDPGGSLSMTMPEYRAYLKKQYALMEEKYRK